MLKATSKVIMTVAAAGMAFAPIAAQANTRAGDQASVYTNSSAAQPGAGRTTEGENVAGVPGILIGIFAAAAVVGGIAIAASEDDGGDNQSPGA